jgi:aspartyl-tRNA(Asn)/glutamyl-tRNA(Gln) amidotransferase subunit A
MFFNVTGQPPITVPCGFSDTRLPIGLQIVGRPFNETMVLRIASAYEEANDWHLLSPPL